MGLRWPDSTPQQQLEQRQAMPIPIVVLSILLAVAFTGAGLSKLTGQSAMREAAVHFGIPWERYRLIGVLELAGAAGCSSVSR